MLLNFIKDFYNNKLKNNKLKLYKERDIWKRLKIDKTKNKVVKYFNHLKYKVTPIPNLLNSDLYDEFNI